jgi:hypothetical protein
MTTEASSGRTLTGRDFAIGAAVIVGAIIAVYGLIWAVSPKKGNRPVKIGWAFFYPKPNEASNVILTLLDREGYETAWPGTLTFRFYSRIFCKPESMLAEHSATIQTLSFSRQTFKSGEKHMLYRTGPISFKERMEPGKTVYMVVEYLPEGMSSPIMAEGNNEVESVTDSSQKTANVK